MLIDPRRPARRGAPRAGDGEWRVYINYHTIYFTAVLLLANGTGEANDCTAV